MSMSKSSLASDRPSNLRLTAVPSPERSEATPPSRLEQAHAQRQAHLREYSTAAADLDAANTALGADQASLEHTRNQIAAIRAAIDDAARDLTAQLPALTAEQRRDLQSHQETERIQQVRIEARTGRLTELEGRRDAIRGALAADTTRLRAAAIAEQAATLATEDSQLEATVADLRSRLIRHAALRSYLQRHNFDRNTLRDSQARVSAAIRSLTTIGPHDVVVNIQALLERLFPLRGAHVVMGDLCAEFNEWRHRDDIRARQDELSEELERLTTTPEE